MDNQERSSGDKVLKILISIHVQLQIQSFGTTYILKVQIKLVLRITCNGIFEWFEIIISAKIVQLSDKIRVANNYTLCVNTSVYFDV